MPPPSPSRKSRAWTFKGPNYPVPLLHYLECLLMGVAILSFLSPVGRGGGRIGRHLAVPVVQPEFFPIAGLIIIAGLAGLAWLIPIRRVLWKKIGYTLAGFGLCWLMALLPRSIMPFSTLLLVIVMRACLYLRWPGRITVAVLAFASFVIRSSLYILLFFNRLEAGGRLPPVVRRRGIEDLQSFALQFTISSALLFGFVLLFVLLMVGTLITEYQSRQKLALANQRLRRFSLLVEDQATLQERNRIARELHDSLGHCLAAQSIQLENVSVWFDQNHEKARGHLATARDLSKEALVSVRQSVSRLRQMPLEGVTLPEAMNTLIQDYEANTKISVEATIRLSESVPKEVAIALYRITQESLTNIAKHAQARHIQLSLLEDKEAVTLTLQDDGQGFTLTTNQRGFGLTSMRERAEAIHGRFQIESAPGQGCTISVVIPRVGGSL